MLEGLLELLSVFMMAVVGIFVAVLQLVVGVIFVIVEFLFLLCFHGLAEAKARSAERTKSLKLKLNSKMNPEAVEPKPPGKFGVIISVVVLLALVSLAGWGLWQKYQRTKTIATLKSVASRIEDIVKDDTTPDPVGGELGETDAWGNPLSLRFSRDLLGASLTVRSAGGDARLETSDDILEIRFVSALTAREIGKALKEKGMEKLAEKWKGFLKDEPDNEF